MNMFVLLLVMAFATIIGSYGALFLKFGAASFRLHPLHMLRNWKMIIGGVLYILSIIIYLFILKYLPLGVAYPLTSMSYIWIALLSKKYLKERVDSWRWAGISLIVSGIVLLSL